MQWTKLKIHLDPMAVEAVTDSLLGMGIEGIEIEDNFLSADDRSSMFIDYTDEDLIPYEEYRVVAYLDESADVSGYEKRIKEELQRIRQFMEIGSGDITIEVMPDEDYENKWKEFYRPFHVGENMIITPIWEEADPKKGETVIKIDPGMAFGSGTHETTSLCVEFLQQIDLEDKNVADVGSGSGILGIVAAKLGASKVTAIDIDENAVKVAAENILSNEVDAVMTVYQGDLLENTHDRVDVVVANILADVIISLGPSVWEVLINGGYFISSGILVSRAEEVEKALISNGYSILETKKKGEWAAVLAKKP